MVKDYKGDPAAARGRALRRHAGQPRCAHAALHARQRHEGGAAAEEDARPDGQDRRADRPGRREVALRHRHRRARSRPTCSRAAPRSGRGRRSRTRSTPARQGELHRLRGAHERHRGDLPRRIFPIRCGSSPKCCASPRSRRGVREAAAGGNRPRSKPRAPIPNRSRAAPSAATAIRIRPAIPATCRPSTRRSRSSARRPSRT